MKRLSVVCVLLLLSLSCFVYARQGRRPKDSHFAVLGVTIGKDNLETLQKKLGQVKQCNSKEHVSLAGYTNSQEELVFEFSEVGGGDVTAFYLKPATSSFPCALSKLPTSAREVVTEGGIRLGMKEQEFERTFGPPGSKNKHGEWTYFWTGESELTPDEKQRIANASPGSEPPAKADVTIAIKARFSPAGLKYFYISKLETL